MAYKITWEPPAGVIKHHFGQVCGRELLEAVLLIEGDRRFDGLRYVINDFSGCTGLSATEAEVEEIAAIDQAAYALNPDIRIAVVATHPDAVAAANAYVISPLNRYVTRVFQSLHEARQWLATPTG
jgi:hypothetical protein